MASHFQLNAGQTQCPAVTNSSVFSMFLHHHTLAVGRSVVKVELIHCSSVLIVIIAFVVSIGVAVIIAVIAVVLVIVVVTATSIVASIVIVVVIIIAHIIVVTVSLTTCW